MIVAMAGLAELKQIYIEHHYVGQAMQDKVVEAGNKHGIKVLFADEQESHTFSDGEIYYGILLSE